MKTITVLYVLCLLSPVALSQVDTSFIYKTNMPYGTLDLRLAKSTTRYYYLQDNKTFSFRESAPGVKTNTYRDMTSWDSSPYTQGNLREKNGSADYFIMNYRLLFPQQYDPSYSKGYPLILMVHGAGERANCWDPGCYWADRNWKPLTNTPAAPTTSNHELLNNDHNLLHGGQVHLNARNLAAGKLPDDPTLPTRAFPGFVLFPQNLNGWDSNGAQDVIRLVRLISKKYNIDPDRIYIHGLSNGGYGTYEVIKRAPWLFAAALPMSATSDASVTSATHTAVLKEVANIPLWIFQGGIDTNPTPSKTRSFVKKFRDAGANVRYKEYGNLGHGVWNTAYNEPDFFSWILSKNKTDIHAPGGIFAICRTNGQGVVMSITKGFRAYQWEKDGVLVDGANSHSLTAQTAGIYRVRFSRVSATPSETDWNSWSSPVTVTESNPSQAQVTQSGTVLLKDLNNYNNAHLHAVGEFAHYYWYKDGVLLDLYGNQDDTTQHPVFKQGTCTNLPACTGNGAYHVVTAGFDNCPSPPSAPIAIYFNNQAPVTLLAPAGFAGQSTGPSTISIQWANVPNESGYEVWRRKKISATTFTTWSLASMSPADATSFLDQGLEPAATYQYKIRAIASGGRSNYTPASSSQFLTVSTQADASPPTTPQNLTAENTGIREIYLRWDPSSDNTGIRSYRILYGDDTVTVDGKTTSVRLQDLDLNSTYTFTVSAIDLGGNASDPSNESTADTYVNGLYYDHSTGGWSDLDQINWSVAEFKGKVAIVTLAPRTQDDYFNFKFDGYLYIHTAGAYEFRTTSDDGSRLALNNMTIVENDGLHGNVTVTSASQQLAAGPHRVTIKYFEYTGGHVLTVQYRGADTGNNWINVPESAWTSGAPAQQEMADARITTVTASPAVSIYPNPAKPNEPLRVVANNFSEQPVRIQVTNMMGEVFYTATVRAEEISGGALIQPTRPIPEGIYIVAIQQGDQLIRQRLILKEE